MNIYQYKTYSEYLKTQKAGYEQKKSLVWASKANIKYICDSILKYKYITNENGKGICHGVRTGIEIDWFREYLPGWEVIGSEIGIGLHEYTYRWDFNKVNPVWIKEFDFIYTNAFDHVYDPEKTLTVWVDQLKSRGILIIEHSSGHEKATKLDPLGATVDDIEIMLSKYGKLKDITALKMPHKGKYEYQYAITGVK